MCSLHEYPVGRVICISYTSNLLTVNIADLVPGRRRTGETRQDEQVETGRAPTGQDFLHVLLLGGTLQYCLLCVTRERCNV